MLFTPLLVKQVSQPGLIRARASASARRAQRHPERIAQPTGATPGSGSAPASRRRRNPTCRPVAFACARRPAPPLKATCVAAFAAAAGGRERAVHRPAACPAARGGSAAGRVRAHPDARRPAVALRLESLQPPIGCAGAGTGRRCRSRCAGAPWCKPPGCAAWGRLGMWARPGVSKARWKPRRPVRRRGARCACWKRKTRGRADRADPGERGLAPPGGHHLTASLIDFAARKYGEP